MVPGGIARARKPSIVDPKLQALTIDELLKVPGFAAYAGQRIWPIVNVRVEGSRIGSLRYGFELRERFVLSEQVAAQKAREIIEVAYALYVDGVTTEDLHLREKPDLDVELADGRHVLAEHSDVHPDCAGSSWKIISDQVQQRLRDDPSLRSMIEGWSLAITVAHSATWDVPPFEPGDRCPGEHVGKVQAFRIAAAIERFLRSRAFVNFTEGANVPVCDASEPLMEKFKVTATVRRDRTGVNIMSAGWKPLRASLEAAVITAFVNKQGVQYNDRPDWLVLSVMDQGGSFFDDLVRGARNPEPFDRVSVLWNRRMCDWAGGTDSRGNAPIQIVDYDARWPARYERERELILSGLGGKARLIEHIGSTAVAGLAAKPVIDVLVAVDDVENEDTYRPDLEVMGHVLRVREPYHRMFAAPSGDVQVHVWQANSGEIARHLGFRDHLRGSEKDRRLYEETKRDLATWQWGNSNDYADAKTEVILDIMRER